MICTVCLDAKRIMSTVIVTVKEIHNIRWQQLDLQLSLSETVYAVFRTNSSPVADPEWVHPLPLKPPSK